ncbi:unnamed protein product [Ixodes pacificus]
MPFERGKVLFDDPLIAQCLLLGELVQNFLKRGGPRKHHHAFKDSFYNREYFYASVSPKCFTGCGKVTNNFRSVFRTRVTLMSAAAFFGNPYSRRTLSSVNVLRDVL